jgi:hypothetical protein
MLAMVLAHGFGLGMKEYGRRIDWTNFLNDQQA